jgi:hypothetical protein
MLLLHVDQASMFLSIIYLLKQNIKVDEVVNIFSIETTSFKSLDTFLNDLEL